MSTDYQKVIESLTGFGSMVARFNQSSFRKATGVTTSNGMNILGGYCAGVCMDWVRRSLLGPGTTANISYSNSMDPANARRRKANVERMAAAWAKGARNTSFVVSSPNAAVHASLKKAIDARSKAPLKFGGTLFKDPVMIPQALVKELLARYKLGVEPWNLTGCYKEECLESDDAQALLKQLGQSQDTDKLWSDYAREMDETFAAQRKLQGRDATSRPFESLSLLKTFKPKEFGNGGQWMYEITNNALRPGCATMIGIGIRLADGSVSGHEVAVHQLDAARFHFFDPNYGIFQYDEDGVSHALQHLFWCSMHKEDAPPIYGENGDTVTNKVDYMVFGPKGMQSPFD